MASFYVFLVTFFVASAYGYDVKLNQQYVPIQQYPYQNNYGVVYTSQMPVSSYNVPTYPAQTYPVNYVIQRQAYYTPYYYQAKTPVPVQGYTVQKVVTPVYSGQTYSAGYPQQIKEVTQKITYPVGVYPQIETAPIQQEIQGHVNYPQIKKDDQVLFPFKGYVLKPQEKQYPYEKQEKSVPTITEYLREDISNKQPVYSSQGQPITTYAHEYAPKYPELYYPSVTPRYQEVTKDLRPNKPVIQVQYIPNTKEFPKHLVKEELKGNMLSDKDYEMNAIKIDRNLYY